MGLMEEALVRLEGYQWHGEPQNLFGLGVGSEIALDWKEGRRGEQKAWQAVGLR